MKKIIVIIIILYSFNIKALTNETCARVWNGYFNCLSVYSFKKCQESTHGLYIKCLILDATGKDNSESGDLLTDYLKNQTRVVLSKYDLTVHNNLLLTANLLLKKFKEKLFLTSGYREVKKQRYLLKKKIDNKASKRSSHLLFAAIDLQVQCYSNRCRKTKSRYNRCKRRCNPKRLNYKREILKDYKSLLPEVIKEINKFFPRHCFNIVKEPKINVIHIGLKFWGKSSKCLKYKAFRKKVIIKLIEKRVLKKGVSTNRNPSIYDYLK